MAKLYVLLMLFVVAGCAGHQGKNSETAHEAVTNPIVDFGADPWVIKEGDMFHYCYSSDRAIWVKSVERISELNDAEPYKIWQAPDSGMYSREIWAPELHRLNDRWYVYFAADDGDNANHRMHVLSSPTGSPQSAFEYIGKITDSTDKWAIDGTVFTHGGEMYFVWSGWEGDVNEAQHLYIAEMESPTKLSSERVLLSVPEYEWEKQGSGDGLPTINEGPEVLKKDGRLFITYSASGSWSNDYCLGLLELTGDEPMDPAAWEKWDEPVFSGTDQVISPGHASFVTTDGRDYMVFHATKFKGGGWANREVRIQEFSWKDGKPDFGQPLANDTEVNMSY